MSGAQEFFTISSMGTLATATAAVIVVTNTLRRVLGVIHIILPFVISVILTFGYAVYQGLLHDAMQWIVAFINSCLLFCTATGTQEVVVEAAKPQPVDKDKHQSQDREQVKLLSSWIRKR
jgi:hypothetical protein